MAIKRRFLLLDENGTPTPGNIFGLDVGKDGRIPLDKLTPQQVAELEVFAVTAEHPVSESEPEEKE